MTCLQRKINLQSTKIAFIGHSYHEKTKSSQFFIDYLKKFFDVEVIFDESAYGKPFADIAHLDATYLAIIFWQNLPNGEILKAVKSKNENLIFVPMYDAVGTVDYSFVHYCKDFKILSFSKTLHEAFFKSNLLISYQIIITNIIVIRYEYERKSAKNYRQNETLYPNARRGCFFSRH